MGTNIIKRLIKIKFTFIISLILVCSLFLLSSCAWFQGNITEEELNQLDNNMAATKRITIYDNSLAEFGKMLEAYDRPVTPIQSKDILNQTNQGVLPESVYFMVATAMNKIGKQIIFIPFEVRYIINEQTLGGKINRLFPKVVITGGITQFVKNIISKEREGEAEGGWNSYQAGGGYEAGQSASRVALDLNMMTYLSQSYIPGVTSSNTMIIRKTDFGWNAFATYMDFGVSFDSDVSENQGIQLALRPAVELSLLELLGRYFKVPYWRCIPGAKPDERMLERMHDEFESYFPNKQNLIVKELLFLHGYKGINRETGTFDKSEKVVLDKAMNKYSTDSMIDLYFKLWDNLPVNTARRLVIIDRYKKMEQEKLENRKKEIAQKAKVLEEQQKKEKAQKEAAELKSKYDGLLEKANSLFHYMDYKHALTEYGKMLELVPGDKYAIQMIAQINQIMNIDKEYDTAISNTKKFIEMEDYESALSECRKALNLKPDNIIAQDMLKYAKKALSSRLPYGTNSFDNTAWNE